MLFCIGPARSAWQTLSLARWGRVPSLGAARAVTLLSAHASHLLLLDRGPTSLRPLTAPDFSSSRMDLWLRCASRWCQCCRL
ncbi:hypothetical protein PR002_g32650, partial [Phytophthora rubi]